MCLRTAPSERYESRTGRGEVTARWGPELEHWTASQHALDVTPLSELKKPYRYMFERLKDRTDVLTEHILTMGERLQKHWGLEEFSQPHGTAQVGPALGSGWCTARRPTPCVGWYGAAPDTDHLWGCWATG